MDKREEKTLYLGTLIFPVRDGEVLLAEKTRKIGKGFLNGYGGGVEPGESARACAVREFGEETGGAQIVEQDLRKVGIVHFKNNKSDGSIFVATIHVYTVSSWTGDIVSTEEMIHPQWYPITTIAEQKLLPADRFWLPRMLQGEKAVAWAEYTPYQEALVGEVRFEPTDSMEED